ncbi:hypothetical protein ADL21_17315 [Streptomyces albus subsp. albus]|nr:hypothetical protein ADL21_17315 [Streptomyces albus subsp. albus]
MVRGELCLALTDGPGAAKALERAYTAAVESHDMPIVATVAVSTAGLAALHGRFHDMAVLLGAAPRLRGAHDPTDLTVRTLTTRGRAALGQEHFTRAYGNGWHLDTAAALNRTDPARLRQESPTRHSPAVSQRRRPSRGEVRQVRCSPCEETAVAPLTRHLRCSSLQLPFFLPGILAQFLVSCALLPSAER